MLRIRLLGACEIRSQRAAIQLRRRELALLALVNADPTHRLERDAIAAMLWPDVSPPNALHSLRQALHRLGRLVPGMKFHCCDARSIVVRGMPACDVAEFRAAIAAGDWNCAAALYAGHFLGSFTLDEAPDFCHWADGVRRHLQRQALQASRRVLELAQDSGDWVAAEKAAQNLLFISPEDEDYLVMFVNLALRLGHWIEAERALSSARTIREAAAPPSARFRRLEEAVARAQSGDAARLAVDELPLVGRSRESSWIRAELDSVLNGHARAAMAVGISGIGKSRLCHNALRVAAIKGFRVISSAGRPLAADVLATLFYELIAQIQACASERPFGTEMELSPTGAEMASHREPIARERMFSAAAEALRNLMSDAPVILFVDDAQWIDEASADFLLYALSRLQDEPLMVLLAVRPEEARTNPAAHALLRSRKVVQLQLGDLAPEAAAELVSAFADRTGATIPQTTAAQFIAQCGGHPFYLIESLISWHLQGVIPAEGTRALPNSIGQLMSTRCGRLSSSAFHVAEVLALLGRRVPHEVLAQVADLSQEEVADALQELSNQAFIRDFRDGPSFVHDLVREWLVAQVSSARGQILHRRAARALRSVRPIALAEIAVHADLGGDGAMASKYAAVAAAEHERRAAYTEAQPLWRMVLRHAAAAGQKRVARERLANCLHKSGKPMDAALIYQQILDQGTLNPLKRLLFRARALPVYAANKVPLEVLVPVLEDALAAPDTTEKAEALTQALTAIDDGRYIQLLTAYSDRLISCVASLPEHTATLTFTNQLAAFMAVVGEWRKVDELQTRSMRIARQLSTCWGHACALAFRATTLQLRGKCRASADSYAEAAVIFAATPEHSAPAMFRLNWGVLLTELADFAAAADKLQSQLIAAQERLPPRHAARAAANLVALNYEEGKTQSASEYARMATDANIQVEPAYAAIVYGIMGLLAKTPAEERVARERLRSLSEFEQPFGGDFSYAYMFLSRLKERAGRWREALALLDRGIAMYEGKDFFCHGRLQLEKARLVGVRDPEAGLVLAREVRARAADAEATLMLNKSEALIRQLKRDVATAARKRARPEAVPEVLSSAVPLAAERSGTRTGMLVR